MEPAVSTSRITAANQLHPGGATVPADYAARLAAMQPETVRVQPMRRNLFH
jgi:hypothetical protein